MRKQPTAKLSPGGHGSPEKFRGGDNDLGSTKTCGDNPKAIVGGDPIAEPIRSKLETVVVDAGLHIVSTPIGNLADITLRALAVLSRADAIACEDTRVTGKLKSAFGLTAPLIPYHEHNAAKATPALIKRLEEGQIVALVSDAGTPLISDPGYRLVGAAIGAGINVIAVPGPSAALAALVASGLPTDRFLFAGFLPSKSGARRKELAVLAVIPASLVFYESPNRLAASLKDMAQALGPRPAMIAREITKKFEEQSRGTLSDLADAYDGRGAPKGEMVIVIGPPGDQPETAPEEIDRLLEAALEDSRVKDAATSVAAATGWPRRAVYQRALALTNTRPDADEEQGDGDTL
ncbi:MAG: 16S rRNA (cytidine(1402)-2'-O)-methyltransferase [Rhodospirillaceae bacterium]|jgi:16S rRNA (cytidine1402-2'-O)-methyltransferase|nr:16S rRNA (cytidine(1402)-2'-O)-methyltransferase [Rhodospirillaceae bacterium]MBT5458090.1 16S rRNA (cytidine(1402)-2'-O)-methyltransferase [Rhodospirillaceae bacterium]